VSLPLQVIAVGQLGVIARNGWYCLETEVSRWPALAGWRGLQLPEVQEHFEHTLHAQDEAWGGDEEGMLENFGLDPGIKIVYEGADEGPVLLKERMQQGKPTLFYFWTPSALLKQFNLSRVSLPEYNKAGFLAGLSDYPMDVITKVASWNLNKIAAKVLSLYSRFILDNDAQMEMLADLDNQKSNVRQIACGWMLRNNATWTSWIPEDEFVCPPGEVIVEELGGREKNCTGCPKGTRSPGGTTTACIACAPGRRCASDATVLRPSVPCKAWCRSQPIYACGARCIDFTVRHAPRLVRADAHRAHVSSSLHSHICRIFRPRGRQVRVHQLR
jgi:hypothetical protein